MSFTVFIINDKIIFDANSYELKSLNNSEEVIVLNAPTSRCLQLLIEKKDEVVSRDDFLEQVWQTRGVVVSQNTFYQNISLLRKSLKKVGLGDDIIITVRRKGFSLAADLKVQPMHNEKISLCDISPASLDEAVIQTTNLPPRTNSKAVETSPGHVTSTSGWMIFILIIVIMLEITSLTLNWLNN